MKFVVTKKGMTTNFFHPSLLLLFWIRDPRSWIRDKHPGSATLYLTTYFFQWQKRSGQDPHKCWTRN